MFATVRERKGNYLIYLGHKDDILYSKVLPFQPPIKSWELYDKFLTTSTKTLVAVDGEGKAHVIRYKVEGEDRPLEVSDHVVFTDAKYKKAYVNVAVMRMGHVYVFVGEDEEGHIRIKRTDALTLEGFSDVNMITDVLNGSVRFAARKSGTASYIFYLTEDGRPKLIDNSLFIHDLAGEESPWFTSRSEHIDTICIDDRRFICGDKGIYEIYYDYKTSRFAMEYHVDYPVEMEPEQVRKILVKIAPTNSPVMLLLAKDGKLYGFGKNIHKLLGDHKEVRNWMVTFEDVEDFWPVGEKATGILIKTKQGDLYYRGQSSRGTAKQDRLLLPTKKRGTVKSIFLASNIDTYIGNNTSDKGKYHYSFFLDNEGNYLIGKAHIFDAKKDSLEKWYGNTILMEDLMVESCFNNDMLIKAACE